MLSLSFLAHVPNASPPCSTRSSLFQASATQRHLAYPISITREHKFKATKTVIALDGTEEKARKGAVLVGEEELPAGLRRELMPKHVAIFTDGSRRWAKEHGLQVNSGQEAGTLAMMEIVKLCARWGIPVITGFAFSTGTWSRSEDEVNFLMNMFEKAFKLALPIFQKEGIKLSIIGDTSKIPSSLLDAKHEAEEATKNNSKTHLILPIDYTGSYDILQACKSISQKVKDGVIQVEDINEKLMGQELETKCTKFPDPDLLIRTGGKQRLSDFYLWQSAYTELYFSPVLWPDFGEAEFLEALASFQERERRYGRRV